MAKLVAMWFSRVGYGGRRVLFTRHGRSLAMVLPMSDASYLTVLEDAEDRAAVEDADGAETPRR